jgi:hypothetical protein
MDALKYTSAMARRRSAIRFKAKLLKPAKPGKGKPWSFLVLPRAASSKLPTRAMTTVQGRINGRPFRATLEPDGQMSHWLKVGDKLREAAGAQVGDLVALQLAPVDKEPEPRIPPDFRTALAGSAAAVAVWSEITPIARRDWIQWITSAKRPETRERRVRNACEMLAAGKRRVCCFDRSGFYSRALGAPEAAD